MKAIAVLLFLASIALNVCFFAGCRPLHDAVYGNPCKYYTKPPDNDSGKDELVRIAGLLEIKTSEKSVLDLSSDIRSKLDRNVDVPTVFNADAFEEMTKIVNSEAEKAMREYQRFISDLQGKRVIVIEPED